MSCRQLYRLGARRALSTATGGLLTDVTRGPTSTPRTHDSQQNKRALMRS